MIGAGNKFLDKSLTPSGDVVTVADDAFYSMILELTAPNKNISFTFNKRKKNYLDAPKTLDPDVTAVSGNEKSLYQDPWGQPYVVLINVKKKGKITVGSRDVAADVVAYSWGPNGTDDSGCNADLDTCTASGVHKNHDDIASWNF